MNDKLSSKTKIKTNKQINRTWHKASLNEGNSRFFFQTQMFQIIDHVGMITNKPKYTDEITNISSPESLGQFQQTSWHKAFLVKADSSSFK